MGHTRKHNRYTVNVMEINGKMTLAKYVNILNISIGGVAFKTEKRMAVGSGYRLTIEGKDMAFTVTGKVAWSTLKENIKDSVGNIIPIYITGMQFTDLADEKIREIANFIEAHGGAEEKKEEECKKIGRRLYVRFNIIGQDQAKLYYYENYTIKDFSLGGMLIESEQTLEPEKKLQMEVFLTEDKHITIVGRVASCRPIYGKEPEIYDIGIEFIDITEDGKEKLKAFIQLLSTIEEGFSGEEVTCFES
jgi:Tfp pilus assembly protein PilZ